MNGNHASEEEKNTAVTGIVLAGGASRRMGTNKALLPVGDKRSIEHAVAGLKPICSRVIISSNDEDAYAFLGLDIVPDRYPQLGPMSGIHAGLSASESRWNVVAACDMPFLDAAVIAALVQIAEAAERREPGLEAVIPVAAGREQPLLAVYRRDVRHGLERRLQKRELRLTDWILGLRKEIVDEARLAELTGHQPERLLFNMNRPEDYSEACRWIGPSDRQLGDG
ncbi:NTP transferase domain-containing protein [Paenibacillus campinasensis]|uniref:Probable molybdenum cofactor guanylyltransferase n=1 Tax=Paenibacillus campinasensis TaxID=66347 RepID=A0ABW9T5Z8_9BACL|nr:molybdenum cofactor guanylyltransferase [Paenibacillus campinasensis]MUG67550.1 NTP transferase domain-containing protein [Paenibacillus campinasensis]